MKNIFLTALLALSPLLGKAQVKTFNYTSTTRETSTMVWSSYREEWDFYERDDKQTFTINWTFALNGTLGNGTIVGNSQAYDVRDIEYRVKNGVTMLICESYPTQNLQREMTIIMSTFEDGDMLIALYDYDGRLAYYYR